MILVVPVWWSVWLLSLSSEALNLTFITSVPTSILLLVPLSVSILIARIVAYRSETYMLGRQWTGPDVLRLAFWRTVSSTVALLALAIGIERIYSRNIVGFAWMLCAGAIALIGKLQLRAAEGLIPRPVKSGELYKRSLVLSKRMGVRLRRVCVVPFGRGRLTNAYGGLAEIAITDDYGHWLHGSELDFVVAHELAHVRKKDALKTLLTAAGIFSAITSAMFVVPHVSIAWRILLNFGVILLPLMVFYALSRHQEFSADRSAIEATGEPEIAIRALISVYRHAEVPAESNTLMDLFSTHPGLWRRVDAIARAARFSSEYVSNVRGRFSEVGGN